jgi:hypothetical protein
MTGYYQLAPPTRHVCGTCTPERQFASAANARRHVATVHRPRPLFPDDDTAVERLAAALHATNHPATPDCELGLNTKWTDPPGPPDWVGRKKCVVDAERIIAALREGAR